MLIHQISSKKKEKSIKKFLFYLPKKMIGKTECVKSTLLTENSKGNKTMHKIHFFLLFFSNKNFIFLKKKNQTKNKPKTKTIWSPFTPFNTKNNGWKKRNWKDRSSLFFQKKKKKKIEFSFSIWWQTNKIRNKLRSNSILRK